MYGSCSTLLRRDFSTCAFPRITCHPPTTYHAIGARRNSLKSNSKNCTFSTDRDRVFNSLCLVNHKGMQESSWEALHWTSSYAKLIRIVIGVLWDPGPAIATTLDSPGLCFPYSLVVTLPCELPATYSLTHLSLLIVRVSYAEDFAQHMSEESMEALEAIAARIPDSLQELILERMPLTRESMRLLSSLRLKTLHFEYCSLKHGYSLDLRDCRDFWSFCSSWSSVSRSSMFLPLNLEKLRILCHSSCTPGVDDGPGQHRMQMIAAT
jgi:hypothetical protein